MALNSTRTSVNDGGSGIALRKEVNGPVTTYYTGAKLNATTPTIGASVDPSTLPKYDVTYSKVDTGNGGGNGGSSGGNTTTYVYGGGYDPSDLYASMLAERNALMQKNYQIALDQLRGAYESNVNSLKNQGEDALREAYVNMMMNKRGLNNSLASAGINGGAAESTMANLFNTYANDRNRIARTLNESLEQAGRTYNTGVANLGMNFNNNYADVLGDYYNQLATAKANLQSALTPTVSKSTYTTPAQTAQSATSAGNRSAIASRLAGYNSYNDALNALNAMNLNLTGDEWTNLLAELRNMYPAAVGRPETW